MKKILLAAALCSSILMAGSNTTEDFFFKNGYEQGYNKGFEIGSKKAFDEAKKIITRYKADIKAAEIGKYLIKSKRLTAPKVFQSLDEDGGLRLTITKSTIEKELSIEDIFNKFGEIPIIKKEDILTPTTTNIDEINSVNISGRDNVVNLPGKANKNNNIIIVSVKKNSKNEDILKKSNTVYSLDNDRFKVMFFSRTEKISFCNSFRICR